MLDIKHWLNIGNKTVEILPIQDICEMLIIKFNKQDELIERLKNKINELEQANWKDKELQQMKEELTRTKEEANLGFRISKEEFEAATKWMYEHEKEKHCDPDRKFSRGGAIGGSYTWEFTPTGIGTFGSIRCSCGDSFTFQEEA